MNTQNKTISHNHTLALKMTQAGIPVFPCLEKDTATKCAKAPYTSKGFKDATTNLDTINAWWTCHPGAVVGVPTGKATGLAVVDGDICKETGEAVGEAQITQLDLAHPNAVKVRTQSGGVQFIHKYVPGTPTNTRQAASHVDIRGDGGYIIAPGSVMGGGAAYTYEGRKLSDALLSGDLPDFPMEAYDAAVATEKARKTQHRAGSEQSAAQDAPTGLDEIADLLSYTDPDAGGYDQWRNVLMALHDHTGGSSDGLALADQWSQRGAKYKPGEVAAKWKTFHRGGGVTVGTIAALARDHGADLAAIARKHSDAADSFTAQSQDTSEWSVPDARFLRPERPAAPVLPMDDVFGPRFASWAKGAAEAKSAPVDYVVLSVLSVLSAVIGNARWVSPWKGWAEPPVIWTILIGLPSAGKSPAIDAVLKPLRDVERPLREAAKKALREWSEKADIAKLAEQSWKEMAKAALKEGKTAPDRPQNADAGVKPHIPRLVVNDGTIERLGAILAHQPRGILQMRDELAGWLEGMSRYSGGGSDRPFWLEAYGGRGYTVERMGRDPLTVDRLTIAVMGGVQPDRLKTLLFKSDDDGLLARFLPIWPEPAPIKRPGVWADEDMMQRVIEKLLSLNLVMDETDQQRPWFIGFDEAARDLMDEFRRTVRNWEAEADGLMLSFVGKLPGLAARISLVLAYLDWAAEGADEPHEITVAHFGRAAHLVEAYILPMARRAYTDAAIPKTERAAHQLVSIIREQKWTEFASRDVLRMVRSGLSPKATLDPVLDILAEADVIREVDVPSSAKRGRPQRRFAVNPATHEVTQ